jgi:NodT family efflux transporter outer membrane factor (OMF) lipoprotein
MKSSLLISVLAISMAGCLAVPRYSPPEMELPDEWHQAVQEDLKEDGTPLQEWWVNFQDPQLTEYLQRATTGNLNLQVAESRIREARALRRVARSQWWPELNAVGSAERSRISENILPINLVADSRTRNIYRLGLDATWELDFWGQTLSASKSAKAAYEATQENYRDVLVLLYAEVASSYIEIRSLQKRIKILEDNLKAQQGTLEVTQNRHKAGLAPVLDVRQAEMNYSRTESRLPSLRSRLIQEMNSFGVLLGTTPVNLHGELNVSTAVIPAPPESMATGIPADVIRQRPDVRRAERVAAAQTYEIGITRGEYYPRFFLAGNFVVESTSTSNLIEDDSRSYNYGAHFKWNLFRGLRDRNTLKAKNERAEQALKDYEETLLRAVEDVEGAMVAYAEEKNRTASLENAVTAAQESVKLVKTLYRNGLTNFQNVLDMERSLFDEQDKYVASQGALSQNVVRIYKAMGGGWTPREDQVSEE